MSKLIFWLSFYSGSKTHFTCMLVTLMYNYKKNFGIINRLNDVYYAQKCRHVPETSRTLYCYFGGRYITDCTFWDCRDDFKGNLTLIYSD